MTDYIFTDGSGNTITVHTDATDTSTNNLTIMQISYNGVIGLSSAPTATQVAFARSLERIVRSKQFLVQLAMDLNYNLSYRTVGGNAAAIVLVVTNPYYNGTLGLGNLSL